MMFNQNLTILCFPKGLLHLLLLWLYMWMIVWKLGMNNLRFLVSSLTLIRFLLSRIGLIHYFLGIEVSFIDEGIVLTQHKFTKGLLEESRITHFQKALTPLPASLKLKADDGIPLADPTYYRSLVGKLNFFTHTRVNLSYSVQALSQFMQSLRDSHLQAFLHTLKYVSQRDHFMRT